MLVPHEGIDNPEYDSFPVFADAAEYVEMDDGVVFADTLTYAGVCDDVRLRLSR